MIKKSINDALGIFGYQIQKVRKPQQETQPANEFLMFEALKRCIDRGLTIGTVVDVGASDGSWSRECLKYLPNANYLLFEAQTPYVPRLDLFKEQYKNVDYILAAAGHREGMIYFDNSVLFGGLASDKPFAENCIEVPVVKVDNEVAKKNLSGPYLIKLDTHGFEVPILEGAAETLKKANLVIIEAYNYQLTEDSLKFYELCEYMKSKGFSPIEMVDLMIRKHDNSLWQMDIFFVPSSNKEFAFNEFE